MQDNQNYSMSFNYPENKDKTVSNFGLKILLAIFLVYIYSKQEEVLGQYIFIFFIAALLMQLFMEMKTFYFINRISLDKSSFVLENNKRIYLKIPFSNLSFKVNKNAIDISDKTSIDFYEQSSKKHLIHFKSTEIEGETFNEFINNLSKISNRDTNDFLATSHNQLLSFLPESMNEETMQGEFVKYTNNAFFTKYKVLVIIGITITIAATLYVLRG